MKDIPLQDFRHNDQHTETLSSTPEQSSCSEAELFALQVTDDSMEPEFLRGCLIIVDRNAQIRDGRYVLAEQADGELVFRQLQIQADQYYLKALHPAYPDTNLAHLAAIRGIIIQRTGKRRSYHKCYD